VGVVFCCVAAGRRGRRGGGGGGRRDLGWVVGCSRLHRRRFWHAGYGGGADAVLFVCRDSRAAAVAGGGGVDALLLGRRRSNLHLNAVPGDRR